MYEYNVMQWIFFFYTYCFLGWCFESTWVSVNDHKLTNRGFIRGPFLPLYGFGAILALVLLLPIKDNLILVWTVGCIGATALEYVTGSIMESLFKVRYWDYSCKKYNYKGQICLNSSLAWGFLAIFIVKVVHNPIERFVLWIPALPLAITTLTITVIFTADFVLSFKAAMDLRDIILKMDRVKDEMEALLRRLETIAANAGEAIAAKRENYSLEELTQKTEKILESLKGKVSAGLPVGYLSSAKDEIIELRLKFNIQLERRMQLKNLKDFYRRHLILDNPLVSVKFREALEELKEAAKERASIIAKKKKDKE